MKSAAFFLAFDADGWHAARLVGDRAETCRVPYEADDAGPANGAFAGSDGSLPGGTLPGEPTGGGSLAAVPAAALAAQLAGWGYRGEGVCLGLPSDKVLAAEVDCANLPRRNRRTAMLYRLEEQLPVDAERVTADFLPTVDGRALGLAVETARVRDVLEALAEVGIEVAAIVPTALLALESSRRNGTEEADYAIVASGPQLDVFHLVHAQPITWNTSSPEGADLLLSIEVDLLAHPVEDHSPRARVVGRLDPAMAEAIEREAGVQLLPCDAESPFDAATRAARDVLAGKARGWVDFRRGALALADPWGKTGGLLRAAVVLGILFLATLTGAVYWRGTRYHGLARRYQRMQAEEYRALYPDTSVPLNVKSRLGSELARLVGISGAGQEVPRQPSALDTLRQIVGSFPAAVRLRIRDLRIGPTDFLIEGQARTHGDAEAVTQALRRAGLPTDPPRTENLAKGGVAFTIAGKLRGAAPPPQPEASTP